MFIQMRGRRWYAIHDIPAGDVQKKLGRKRYVKSLKTRDPELARVRAAQLEAVWLANIARAKGPKDLDAEAAEWRETLRKASGVLANSQMGPFETDKSLVEGLIMDAAVELAGSDPFAAPEDQQAALDASPEAQRFVAVATGELVKLDGRLEEYVGSLKATSKTIDQARAILAMFCARFPYTADVQRKRVQAWIDEQSAAGRQAGTTGRQLSVLRQYWEHLAAHEIVPDDPWPFDRLSLKAAPRRSRKDGVKPFSPAQVVQLLDAARAKGDGRLVAVIEIGMWTGMRLEEICSLRAGKGTNKVELAKGRIKIEDAKSPAGERKVPIHSKLEPILRRLTEAAGMGGYLVPRLNLDKHGDRSGAMAVQFSEMKRSAPFNFGRELVFHSIRRTVTTQLEQAGVPENVAADIIGHEKPRITYGLYSGGTSLAQKREAIEKLAYPVA